MKTVVLSKFPNDKPKEIIELNLPVTPDSSGLLKILFENGELQSIGKVRNKKPKENGPIFFIMEKKMQDDLYKWC